MEIAEIEAKLRVYKAAGHTSRIDLPFIVVEKLIADAKRWRETPSYIRDVAEAVRAGQ